jgi:hypothetical protein
MKMKSSSKFILFSGEVIFGGNGGDNTNVSNYSNNYNTGLF